MVREEGAGPVMLKPCQTKARIYENNLQKLYDSCIPKERFSRNFFIIKALKLEGLGSRN